jgi:predicted lipoprotein with Yx(FWY)xxD motif
MNRVKTLVASCGVAAGAVAFAACGGSSSYGNVPAPSSPAGAAVIKTASVGQLGTIVVNGQGMTLYRFDADSNNPPTSHCTGSCAAVWTPVAAGTETPVVQGINASQVGKVTRPDGTEQLTLAGWPLYTYTGDTAPGVTNGQGLNLSGGVWWAVTPAGDRAGTPSGASPSASPGGPSY